MASSELARRADRQAEDLPAVSDTAHHLTLGGRAAAALTQNDTVADLIVLTGPPGAGKSTVARTLTAGFEPSALVAGDEFFAFLERGLIPPWLPEAHAQNKIVIQASAAAAGRLASGGYTVVYDGVVGPWFVPTFTAATGLRWLHYVVLLPSEQRCVARVATRVGHGFTDLEATRHMYQQFADSPIDPRHVVMDPPDEPEAAVASIRQRMTTGSFVFRSNGALL